MTTEPMSEPCPPEEGKVCVVLNIRNASFQCDFDLVANHADKRRVQAAAFISLSVDDRIRLLRDKEAIIVADNDVNWFGETGSAVARMIQAAIDERYKRNALSLDKPKASGLSRMQLLRITQGVVWGVVGQPEPPDQAAEECRRKQRQRLIDRHGKTYYAASTENQYK